MKLFFVLVASTFFALSANAQTGKSKTDTTVGQQATYTCPMHADVISTQPGKCPKCKMDLVKAKTYTCPMHPKVLSNKAGKCPVCHMNLVEVKETSSTPHDSIH